MITKQDREKLRNRRQGITTGGIMEQEVNQDQEQKPVVFFDEEKRYDEEVAPLVRQLTEKCQELKMPFLIRVICKTEPGGCVGAITFDICDRPRHYSTDRLKSAFSRIKPDVVADWIMKQMEP